ncbi:MAG: hypothetical protein ABW000_15440 [Actinoplanes sp.]
MTRGRSLLTVLTGASVPVPAPAALVTAVERIVVTHAADTGSGFQLVLRVGRGGGTDLVDFSPLRGRHFGAFHRVVLVLTLDGRPAVLADGVITHRELTPGPVPGAGRLTVTGEDAGVLMDLAERTVEYPAQDEAAIARRILLGYARHGVVPRVIPPPLIDPPLPVDRVPVQLGTDRDHLTRMAARFGYVFHVRPGPAPLTSTAYWGPAQRTGPVAPALTVGPGPQSTVERLTFRSDPLAPVRVAGAVQDRLTGARTPVFSTVSRRPPLAARPDAVANLPWVRTVAFRESGLSTSQALARAQGRADAGGDSLTATGSLDTTRYGALLTAGGLVPVRGAGWEHDGLYQVRRVTHTIEVGGRHSQEFTLSREGLGSTVAVVRP